MCRKTNRKIYYTGGATGSNSP